MKRHICAHCRHVLWSVIYTPHFCRACGGTEIKTAAYLDWLILAAVAAPVVLIFLGVNF